jgi:hypothetical protein
VVPGSRPLFDSLRSMQEAGIGATLIIGDPDQRFGTGPVEEQVSTIKRELDGQVDAIEGPNEYDATGEDFAPKLLQYMRRLGQLLERDPVLRDRPVVAPSFLNPSSYSDVGTLGGIDYGNMHSYPGGEPPEEALAYPVNLARQVAGDRPLYSTETGYHNALRAEGERVQPGVSEQAAGVYLPRLYLEYFKEGVARTFAYELLDQRPDPGNGNAELNFGLLAADFRQKPAFRSMMNLIRLLKDDGGGAQASGRMSYSLVDDEGVHTLLLRKSNGKFYLAVWRADTSVWNTDSRRPVSVRPRAVEVRFDDSVQQIAAYRPSESPRPVYVRRGANTVRADLGADAWIFEVTPEE